MITEHDLRRAAPNVLKRLRVLAGLHALPPSGTVAGQAVASLFYEELGLPFKGPINDIDLFVDCQMPRELRGRDPDAKPSQHVRTQKTASSGKVVNTGWDDYTQIKFIALRSSIKILSTYKVGLLNYTLVSDVVKEGRHGDEDNLPRSLAVIQGFDLNLVSVGIDIESGEVVFTPDFLKFCNTGVIEAQTCNTPAHTLVRLAKKHFGQEIVGATCDYEQQRQMLEMALLCQNSHHNWDAVIHSFGKKYASWAQQYQEHLPPLVPNTKWGHQLHSFDVSARPISPVEQMLIDASKTDNYTIFCSGFITDFPKLHQTLFSDSPSAEMVARKKSILRALDYGMPGSVSPSVKQQLTDDASFDLHDLGEFHSSENDLALCSAVMLNQLQVGMGLPSIVYDIKGFAPEDSAAIFFGQKCAAVPRAVTQVIKLLEDASEPMSLFFSLMNMKADELLEWSLNPKELMSRRIESDLSGVLLRVSGLCLQHPDDPRIAELGLLFLDGLHHAIERSTTTDLLLTLAGDILNISHINPNPASPWSVPNSRIPPIIATLPEDQRAKALWDVGRLCIKEWPDLSALPLDDRKGLEQMVVLCNILPDDPLAAPLVSHHLSSPQALHDFILDGCRGISFRRDKEFFWGPWLDRLPGENAFNLPYFLARHLIANNHLDEVLSLARELPPADAASHLTHMQNMFIKASKELGNNPHNLLALFNPPILKGKKYREFAKDETILLPPGLQEDILSKMQQAILNFSVSSTTHAPARPKRMM